MGEAVQPIPLNREAQLLHPPDPEAILLLPEEVPKAIPVILQGHTHQGEDLHLIAADLHHPDHLLEDPHTPQEVPQAVLPQAVLPEEDGNYK